MRSDDSSDDKSSKGEIKKRTCCQRTKIVVDHWAYMIFFWIIYSYLLLNDALKLYFLPKPADLPINALTFLCLIYFDFISGLTSLTFSSS